MSRWNIVAEGLAFPEGPIACSDGSVLVVEMHRGTLTRVDPGGAKGVVAECGGGPNGGAVGPDGLVYVCNNGGFEWHRTRRGTWFPGKQAADYRGGSIQRVDPTSGRVETLYTECDGHPLRGPNDIVFDRAGGFWFTDTGKERARERDITGIYYASIDGDRIVRMAFPFYAGPNGIGLSPDETRLYVSETYSSRIFFWELDGPGRIVRNAHSTHGGHDLAIVRSAMAVDSMAIDAEGNVCVATIRSDGGGITVLSPTGEQRYVESGDMFTTNLCFGGADMKTAFITRAGTGTLVEMPWETVGHGLAFNL